MATLVEPKGRCSYCFFSLEGGELCRKCRTPQRAPWPTAFLFFKNIVTSYLFKEKKESPEAVAGFFFYHWVQLGWEVPDFVIPVGKVEKVTQAFCSFFSSISKRRPLASYADLLIFKKGRGECKKKELLENKIVLFLQEKPSEETTKKLKDSLVGTFPKKIFQLDFFGHDDSTNC